VVSVKLNLLEFSYFFNKFKVVKSTEVPMKGDHVEELCQMFSKGLLR
jgi:hypothetical protein